MPHDRVALPGRRRMLQGVGAVSLALAGGSLLAGYGNQIAPFLARRVGNQPETTTIRLPVGFGTCISPVFLADEFLRKQGFTDVQYLPVTSDADFVTKVSAGEIDLAMQTAAVTVTQADTTGSFVHLAGIHVGCYELFATPGIHAMSQLKGKRVAINALGSASHIYMAAMAAYIGLDPNQDFTWVTDTSPQAMQAFANGQIDAFMADPPRPALLHTMGQNNVIVNMHIDRPWSQQYCCMLIGNRAFVKNNPIAAKQAVGAVLKAADLCAADPKEAAGGLFKRGVIDANDLAATVQVLSRDVSYDRWRDYDPEATIRFYGLLLQQVGMVKSDPNTLIAQSTDWRILNELKRELKA